MAAPLISVTQTITEPPVMETLHVKLTPKALHQPHPPPARAAKMKLKLDPLRALEPAKKKLSTLEAQRIMAVLVDTIKRTQLISALPYVTANLDDFADVLGPELQTILEEHGVIMQSYDELKAQAEQLLEKEQRSRASSASSKGSRASSAGSDRSQAKSNQSSISQQADMALHNFSMTAQRLQFSCKNILRALSRNPSAVKAIIGANVQRSDEANQMIGEMHALKDILMNKLLTTPVEEQERNTYLKQVTVQERQNATVIAKFEVELEAALEDKENEVRELFRLKNYFHSLIKLFSFSIALIQMIIKNTCNVIVPHFKRIGIHK